MSIRLEDSSPLMNSGYTVKTSPSTSGEPSHTVKQSKGDFATNGVQPSLAMELDISTIEHVKWKKKKVFMVRVLT